MSSGAYNVVGTSAGWRVVFIPLVPEFITLVDVFEFPGVAFAEMQRLNRNLLGV